MIELPPPLDDQLPSHARPPYKLRVNIICLIGGILAVLSLFLPWVSVDYERGNPTLYGAFDLDEPVDGYRMFPDGFRYSMTLFIVGTVLALVTPLGGIPLMIGSSGFILVSVTTEFDYVSQIFWLGAIVGLLSSCIVMVSLFEPFGKGFKPSNEDRVLARLLVWSMYR